MQKTQDSTETARRVVDGQANPGDKPRPQSDPSFALLRAPERDGEPRHFVPKSPARRAEAAVSQRRSREVVAERTNPFSDVRRRRQRRVDIMFRALDGLFEWLAAGK